jgi:uncharacterized membrane protein
MNIQVLIGLLLTIAPVFELRGGLPIIVEYVVRNGFSVWPYFLLVLVLNVCLIFFIFLFFDFVHGLLMKLRLYKIVIGSVLRKLQKNVDKVRSNMSKWGYLALMFFVAVPLPGTGAWTGTMVAWAMGLDRTKSFFAIAAGVVIAGVVVLLISLGFFNGIN